MTYQKTVAQVFGRPVDTDRTKSLQGDIYDVGGHIKVANTGYLHYSFKGPALVGQVIPPFANAIPATSGIVDIAFPCRFTEKPIFTSGFEYSGNYSAGYATISGMVVDWRLGNRDETGFPFYDGARIVVG